MKRIYFTLFTAIALVACRAQNPPAAAEAADPLADKLQADYSADATTAHKLVRARQLAAAYRFSATALSQDPDTQDAGALHAKVRAAVQLAMPDNALVPIRTDIAREFNAALGQDATAKLDDAARARAAAEFARVASILEVVK